MIEVYTWEPNANSGKPLFCLSEKGVPFTHHYVDMGAHEHFSPEFLAINPDGTIPAIVHDGFVMTESTPAMEYIDEVFEGPSLRPEDPFRRWEMRILMRYMDNVVAPSLAMIASNRLAAPRFVGQDPAELRAQLDRIPLPERRTAWEKLMFQSTSEEEIAESERRVAEAIGRFDAILERHPWLAGEEFSLADIGVFATFYGLSQARPAEVNESKTPNLLRWLRRCHERPALQAAFRIGRGFIGQRAAEIRQQLSVSEATVR
ncbi:glutathione S-transferase family protein [Altererythrobacter salegens]|uniref:Glutathione S-transferase family protein n=1 Tax=Croceibacterium salegens TaxID=1737568 RepID=A0A6I4SW15_9SPHN|nr:glutathione S-transferase family protein [Croceibacterium salegens]MXO59718.1 glutathione S-transferase family protein [Croceibacterium salegens]